MKCLKVCAGDLRHLVEVYSQTKTDDGAGGFSTSWTKEFNIYCSIEEKSGRETNAHGSLEYQTSVEFITRYRDDVYVDQRLVHDGVNYNIRRVDNKFRNSKYMLIVCDGWVVN